MFVSSLTFLIVRWVDRSLISIRFVNCIPPRIKTTIAAASFSGGVILAADSRTSSGSYVANKVQDKISRLADNVYLCRSGSASDTQAVVSYVRNFIQQQSVQEGQPGYMDVGRAATVAMHVAYNNKDRLSAGMIIAGWDERDGGSVYALPLGGTLLRCPFTIGGSGSAYIYGWCDDAFRDGMDQRECEAFCARAVSLAMARDGSSGGVIRMVIVTKDGIERKMLTGAEVEQHYGEIGIIGDKMA